MSFFGGAESLHFAARPTVVGLYLGQLLAVLGLLTLVPAAVSLAGGGGQRTVFYLLAAATYLGLGAAGVLAARWGRADRRRRDIPLQRNEALVVTALAFVIPPFVTAPVLMSYGLTWVDAFFEGVSGVTTTGLSTLATVEDLPATFHFARAWMQWTGGLGVVVLSLAMLVEPGVAARKLGMEAAGNADIAGGTRSQARTLLMAYLVLTGLAVLVIGAAGAAPFDALVHALAAVSTGGFSSHDDSLAGMGAGVTLAILGFSLLGAVSFHVYLRLWYGRRGDLVVDAQTRTLLGTCAVTAAAVLACLSIAGPSSSAQPAGLWSSSLDALVLAVSAQSTAGFATIPPADLDAGSQFALIVAMFLGGGMGSTAGGIKIFRVLILLALFRTLLIRASTNEAAVVYPRMDGQVLEAGEIQAALTMILVMAIAVAASWGIFLVHGEPALTSLFDVTSAIGTVGLSAGVVGPDLADPLKLVLCFDMLLGRVEALALIILLFPGTWIGKRRNSP